MVQCAASRCQVAPDLLLGTDDELVSVHHWELDTIWAWAWGPRHLISPRWLEEM